MKCVVCKEDANFVYSGMSLCFQHFKDLERFKLNPTKR